MDVRNEENLILLWLGRHRKKELAAIERERNMEALAFSPLNL